MVLSLSAKGFTHEEISAHPAEDGAQCPSRPSSTVADKVMSGMAEWHNRPPGWGHLRVPRTGLARRIDAVSLVTPCGRTDEWFYGLVVGAG
jgi:hypothetical protein